MWVCGVLGWGWAKRGGHACVWCFVVLCSVKCNSGCHSELGREMEEAQPQPRAFVNWKVIEKILGQALSSGVQVAMLLQLDGALLTVASKDEERISSGSLVLLVLSFRVHWRYFLNPAGKEKIQAALIANIWKTFDEVGIISFRPQPFLRCHSPSSFAMFRAVFRLLKPTHCFI